MDVTPIVDRQSESVGQRLIPTVIDELARDKPHRILYNVALGPRISDGFQSTTARSFANSINRASWWLHKILGRGSNFPTIGYLGPGDLRYLILTVAAIKVGYKMLFISPRNSLEGDLAVLERANCDTWLLPAEGGNIDKILAQRPLQTIPLPDLPVFLDEESVEHYEYNKTFEEARSDPCWVLHTSGSTGLPKPVVRCLASAASTEANRAFRAIDGRKLSVKDFFNARIYITFPLFHSAGLSNSLLWPIFYDSTVVFGPKGPVTTEVIKYVIKNASVEAIFAAPSTLEDIVNDAEAFSCLENIRAVAFGGGPLSKSAGDAISLKARVVLFLGTTESGWLPAVENDPEEWNYLHFHPDTGLVLRSHPSGFHELFAVRNEKFKIWQPIFTTFPDLQEYNFKDLFSGHPTKDNLWRYEGRADNIIVLSNGEKFNPLTMENFIERHPSVRSVLIGGKGKFQISAIIELVDNGDHGEVDQQNIINSLWPTIQEANEHAPAHARLFKDHILIAGRNKQFHRASKGTVLRSLTLNDYQEEIDALDISTDGIAPNSDISKLDLSSLEAVTTAMRHYLTTITTLENLADDDDIFVAGVDSLQVLSLFRILRQILSAADNAAAVDLKLGSIYRHPTISSLSKAVYNTLITKQVTPLTKDPIHDQTIQELFEKYDSDLPNCPRLEHKQPTSNGKAVVILTGSSGSLGSYILEDLITSSLVREVWCLNRSEDSEKRQSLVSSSRGLSTDWMASNVHFFQADLSLVGFGIPAENFEYLREHATYVIHNQWPVDFNLSLSSFEPQLHGIRNLIDFVFQAKSNIRIMFTSSVGVAHNWPTAFAVPEQPIFNFAAPQSGYGKSKLVAERLLVEASTRFGLDIKICRLTQIAGPVLKAETGSWNRKEWLPSIIDASAHFSILPTTLGTNDLIDWIPVDLLSTIIVELSLRAEGNRQQVFNIVNPRKASWGQLLPVVKEQLSLPGRNNLRTISWYEWLNEIRTASSPDSAEYLKMESLSALKLLDYYETLSGNDGDNAKGRTKFVTEAAEKVSNTLYELKAVDQEWMTLWMKQWGY